jgi:integrase
MGVSADRLLRLMVASRQPVADYSLDILKVVAREQPKPIRLRMEVSVGEWRARSGVSARSIQAAPPPRWRADDHWRAMAVNTSMRGVEVKRVRRRDVDLEKVLEVESATGKGVLYVGHSKNEASKRKIPRNSLARDAVARMLKRADDLGHTVPEHYLWCASQHHKFDPTKLAANWDTAWRALREAAGLPGPAVSRSPAACRVPDYAGFIDGAILFVQAVIKLALADSA